MHKLRHDSAFFDYLLGGRPFGHSGRQKEKRGKWKEWNRREDVKGKRLDFYSFWRTWKGRPWSCSRPFSLNTKRQVDGPWLSRSEKKLSFACLIQFVQRCWEKPNLCICNQRLSASILNSKSSISGTLILGQVLFDVFHTIPMPDNVIVNQPLTDIQCLWYTIISEAGRERITSANNWTKEWDYRKLRPPSVQSLDIYRLRKDWLCAAFTVMTKGTFV